MAFILGGFLGCFLAKPLVKTLIFIGLKSKNPGQNIDFRWFWSKTPVEKVGQCVSFNNICPTLTKTPVKTPVKSQIFRSAHTAQPSGGQPAAWLGPSTSRPGWEPAGKAGGCLGAWPAMQAPSVAGSFGLVCIFCVGLGYISGRNIKYALTKKL